MRLRGHTSLGRSRPFVSEGLELGGHLFELPDGRRKLLLLRDGEEAAAQNDPDRATRIIYKDTGRDNKARFLGLYIGASLRGLGLSGSLVEFSRQHIEQEGFELDGTDCIRKPVLALTLRRLGYRAASTACLVEVMGGDKKHPDTPVIRMVSNSLPPAKMIDGYGSHNFYRIAEPGAFDGVPLNEDRVVALHTRYLEPLELVPDDATIHLPMAHMMSVRA